MSDENYKDTLKELYGSDEEALIRDQYLNQADKAIDAAVYIMEKIKESADENGDIESMLVKDGIYQDILDFLEKYSTD